MGVKLTFVGDILASVKPYVSFPKIWTTNMVFQLHSKVSALLLFTSCHSLSTGRCGQETLEEAVLKVKERGNIQRLQLSC